MAKKHSTLKSERPNLGVESDAAIARRIGCTTGYIRQVRVAAHIPAAPRRRPSPRTCQKPATYFLTAVPLSAEQRRRLAEQREQHGWSQGELAERVGVSRLAINRIENGAMSPSGELLTKLCQHLGLDWFVEIRTKLMRKIPGKQRPQVLEESWLAPE